MDSSFTKLFITFVIFITSGESYKIIHENNNSIQYHKSYSGNENIDSYNERVSPEVLKQKMPLLLLKLIVDIISYKETKIIDSNISKEYAKGKISMLIRVAKSFWNILKTFAKIVYLILFLFIFFILAYDRIMVTTGYIGDEGQENGRNSEVIVRYWRER